MNFLIDLWNILWFICGLVGLFWIIYFLYLLFTYKEEPKENNKVEPFIDASNVDIIKVKKEMDKFNQMYFDKYGERTPLDKSDDV